MIRNERRRHDALCFQSSSNLPRSKSRVRIPCPAFPNQQLAVLVSPVSTTITPLLIYKSRFEGFHCLDSALYGRARVDVEVHVYRVLSCAKMKSDLMWSDIVLTPQSFPVCIRGEYHQVL